MWILYSVRLPKFNAPFSSHSIRACRSTLLFDCIFFFVCCCGLVVDMAAWFKNYISFWFLVSLQMQKCKNAKWQVGHYLHSRLLIDNRRQTIQSKSKSKSKTGPGPGESFEAFMRKWLPTFTQLHSQIWPMHLNLQPPALWSHQHEPISRPGSRQATFLHLIPRPRL